MQRPRDPVDQIIVIVNFTPVPREGYRVGVPSDELTSRPASFHPGNRPAFSRGLLQARLTPAWQRTAPPCAGTGQSPMLLQTSALTRSYTAEEPVYLKGKYT